MLRTPRLPLGQALFRTIPARLSYSNQNSAGPIRAGQGSGTVSCLTQSGNETDNGVPETMQLPILKLATPLLNPVTLIRKVAPGGWGKCQHERWLWAGTFCAELRA
jgi:hypothetical protein